MKDETTDLPAGHPGSPRTSTRRAFLRVAAAVGVGAALPLAGCSSSSVDGTIAASSPRRPRHGNRYRYGYVAYNLADEWNAYSSQAFAFAADREAVDVVCVDSANSIDGSVRAMKEVLDAGVDGVSVFPITPEQGGRLAQMANAASVPVTFENTRPVVAEDRYVSLVACNYAQIGASAMDYIAKKHPGARILYVAGLPGGGVFEQYQRGILDEVDRLAGAVHLAHTVYGNWEEETAEQEVASALAAADFDVVFANNELMAHGASRAVKAAGLHHPIVTTGGGPMGLTMIANGDVEATMSAPVSLQGMMTFRCLHEFVTSGTRSRKFIPLLTIPVDRSNIDAAVSWQADARNLAYVDGIR